jgi:hypothetical protein
LLGSRNDKVRSVIISSTDAPQSSGPESWSPWIQNLQGNATVVQAWKLAAAQSVKPL